MSLLRVLLLFSVAIYLSSCSNDTVEHSQNLPVTGSATITGIVVPPQKTYYNKTQLIKDGTPNLLVGYNNANHSLDYFKMNDEVLSFHHQVKFNLEGPDKLGEISAFVRLNKDSNLLLSRNYLTITDDNGTEINRYYISTSSENTLNGIDLARYHPTAAQEKGMNIGVIGKDVYLPLNYYEDQFYKDLAATSDDIALLAKMNLVTSRIEELPIRYPEKLQTDLYGFGASFNVYYGKGKIVYNFTGFPEVYVFDLQTQQTEVIANEHDFPATPVLNGHVSKHMMLMTQYAHGVFDERAGILHQAILLPKTQGERMKIYIRSTDITTGEFTLAELPRRHGFAGMFANEGRVYVPVMSSSEDSIKFTGLPVDL